MSDSTRRRLSFSVRELQSDLPAGFTVSLLALPLCIGISAASGFPPVAGLFTAIIGGIVVSFISGAHLTIKGPAAGLIVIALGAVTELGNGQPAEGYRYALACIVVAGVLQVAMGFARAGVLADLFPVSVVNGMLSAIGLIIVVRQFFPMTGYQAQAKDFGALVAEIPSALKHLHPLAGGIGLFTLVFLFAYPLAGARLNKKIPGPLLAMVLASVLAYVTKLDRPDSYLKSSWNITTGPAFMVQVPSHPGEALAWPDFSRLWELVSIKFIILFALIGTLETLVSAKAVEKMDPWRRHAPLNRDLTGVGVGNIMAGLVGGLPMITEIVRSSANINSGARTWWSNVFHGMFLLGFLTVFPHLIQRVPMSALGALLVYTGFHLAKPAKFIKAAKVGFEQILVLLTTVVLTVFVDLLVGLLGGTMMKYLFLLMRGLHPRNTFRAAFHLSKDQDREITFFKVSSALVFCNFTSLKRKLNALPVSESVVIDFSECPLIDHSALNQLEELKRLRQELGGSLECRGLQEMKSHSRHPMALRYR